MSLTSLRQDVLSSCISATNSPPSTRRRKLDRLHLKPICDGILSGILLRTGGIYRAGFSVQVGICVAAKVWKSRVAELERKEDDESNDDDWKSSFFGESSKMRNSTDEEEEVSDIAREEEKSLTDWASKARERAIQAIQERELPVAALLKDGNRIKKKKKTKKKRVAVDVRVKKGNVEKHEKMSRGSDQNKGPLSSATDMRDPIDKTMMVNLGSSIEDSKVSVAFRNYSKYLSKNLAGDISSEYGEETGDVFSCQRNRILSPATKCVSSSVFQTHSRPSRQKRQEDFDLNRRLVEAGDSSEVLSLVGEMIGDTVWGLDGFPLSPFNVSTALHRIAKHMDTVSMHKSDRLSFARTKTMAQLVSAAIEYLPQSSAQSISNIAWALSKVGGYLMYAVETDRLAQVVMTKILDLEPQHIANTAGALASMHHSIPPLFEALDDRARFYHRDFQPQELAQLLWAFATMNQPATGLLDSLDSECGGAVMKVKQVSSDSQLLDDHMVPCQFPDNLLTNEKLGCQEYKLQVLQAKSKVAPETKSKYRAQMHKQAGRWNSAEEYFANFSLSQLASLSWSYTVLGQLKRPSFTLIWHALLEHSLGTYSQNNGLPLPSLQLSQLYQIKLSLQLEYPELGLSLSEPIEISAHTEWNNQKCSKKSTSVTQLHVERLLVGTGRKWVSEYTAADYSLDAALVEEKIALEIDGPSHFARNTGTPLGHTILKRRQLSAAGWTILSIPYQEWDDQLGEEEQTEYLYNLLRNHL